jgi:hypothetical protein
MFQHHVETYLPKLQRSDIAIGIKSDMLAEYGEFVISELRELVEMGIRFKFFHDVSESPEDRKAAELLSQIADIPGITVVPISEKEGFYGRVAELHSQQKNSKQSGGVGNKLVFLERGILQQRKQTSQGAVWNRIKLFTPDTSEEDVTAIMKLKRNVQCRVDVALMRKIVSEGKIDRVHIVPVEHADALKDELFTLEGAGTLIESNFAPKVEPATEKDVGVIRHILLSHETAGQLRPRDIAYLSEHFARFLVARIDDIPVGCVEIIPHDETTVEFGAIAVNRFFLDFRVGKKLLDAVESLAGEK